MARLRIAEREEKVRKILVMLRNGKGIREIKSSVKCSYELINQVYHGDFNAKYLEKTEQSEQLIPIELQKKLLGWKAVQQALRGWNHANH